MRSVSVWCRHKFETKFHLQSVESTMQSLKAERDECIDAVNFHVCCSLIKHTFLVLVITLSPASAAHMFVGVGPSTEVWAN